MVVLHHSDEATRPRAAPCRSDPDSTAGGLDGCPAVRLSTEQPGEVTERPSSPTSQCCRLPHSAELQAETVSRLSAGLGFGMVYRRVLDRFTAQVGRGPFAEL